MVHGPSGLLVLGAIPLVVVAIVSALPTMAAAERCAFTFQGAWCTF